MQWMTNPSRLSNAPSVMNAAGPNLFIISHLYLRIFDVMIAQLEGLNTSHTNLPMCLLCIFYVIIAHYLDRDKLSLVYWWSLFGYYNSGASWRCSSWTPLPSLLHATLSICHLRTFGAISPWLSVGPCTDRAPSAVISLNVITAWSAAQRCSRPPIM